MKYSIAIVASHPIQYQSPWFQALARHPVLQPHVYYCHQTGPSEQSNAGFGVNFDWDVDLLDGFEHKFLKNVSTIPSIGRFRGLDTPQIGSVIGRGCFDAVIVLGWQYKSFWQAITSCWKTGTPVMVRGDSHLHSKRVVWKRALKWPLYRSFIPRFDACLAVGSWSREYFLHFGASSNRVFLVPHVIDVCRFSQNLVEVDVCGDVSRSRWEIPPQDTVVLFAGKFIGKKRPMDFVEGVRLARAAGARVHGLMIGDGPLRQECERYAAATQTPVHFAGFMNQSEIATAYLAADVLVLPSDETWGLVVNEAMASGRPCIVSDQVGCGPDLVIPGRTGDIYPLGNVEALAEKLVGYDSNRDGLSQMGKEARAMSARYEPEVAVQGVINALETGIGKRGTDRA